MISAHGTWNLPAGNFFLRVPGTTTARGGTSPGSSGGSGPRPPMMGVEDVITPFAPSTASRPTRTPSTTMHREPTNAPSSTITGIACSGSRTPPMPTPPDRCTSVPICAHEPTVAHVSTIVPEPTHAPTFTYDGMSTTPGAM